MNVLIDLLSNIPKSIIQDQIVSVGVSSSDERTSLSLVVLLVVARPHSCIDLVERINLVSLVELHS